MLFNSLYSETSKEKTLPPLKGSAYMLTQQCAFGREMSNLSPADSQGKVSSEFCGIQTEQQLTSATEKILMK